MGTIEDTGKTVVEAGGVEVKAGGLTVTDGGMTVTSLGLESDGVTPKSALVVSGDAVITGDSVDADDILALSKASTAKMSLKVLSTSEQPVKLKNAVFEMMARGDSVDVLYSIIADGENNQLQFVAASTVKMTIPFAGAVTVNSGG